MKTFYIVRDIPGEDPAFKIIEDEIGGIVCQGCITDVNAELIAAAPMMLRALQRITHPMADDDDLEFALDLVHLLRG